MKICLDPGHGGNNRGCKIGAGDSAIDEADYVLGFCRLLAAELRARGHTVVITRLYDGTVPLPERGRISARFNADLVLVVHVNVEVGKYHGGLLMWWPGNEVGRRWAESICAWWPKRLTCRAMPAPTDSSDEWAGRACNTISCHHDTAVLVELFDSADNNDLAYALSVDGQVDMRRAICAALEA
jgi:N-acetylmuramoyl-L-alanine amidase